MHIANKMTFTQISVSSFLHNLYPGENKPQHWSFVILVSCLNCEDYICIESKYSLMYFIPNLSIFMFHFLSSELRPRLIIFIQIPNPEAHINDH